MEDPLSRQLLLQISPDTGSLILWIVLLLVLLISSGLISASEMAFFSLSPTEQEELETRSQAAHRAFLKLMQNPRRLLATILVANNMVNISIVFVSTFLIQEISWIKSIHPALAFLFQAVIVTFLILLFGEILPKVYAKQFAHNIVTRFHPLIRFLNSTLYLLTLPLTIMGHWLDKRLKKHQASFSSDELSAAIELTSDPSVSEEERKIWKGIVEFGRITVKETMKPRMDVEAVDISTPYDQLIDKILDVGYSRIPVYRNTFDQIEGILYIKDLLPHLHESAGFNWQKLIRPALFVPENKPIDDLLREFQDQKLHMAVVVDEYGGSSGIVTLEDVIEEIVGEINDEFDDEEVIYSRIDKDVFVFEGKTSLIDVCRIIDMSYDDVAPFVGEADTLAGLILNLTGSMPSKGHQIKAGKLEMVVESVDKRRIKRVRVHRKSEYGPESSPILHSLVVAGILSLLSACGNSSDDYAWGPRPKGYPVIPLPEQTYQPFLQQDCPFTFEYSSNARILPYNGSEKNTSCWFNIFYPSFRATIYFTYYPVKENLSLLIDESHRSVNNHIMMADEIRKTPLLYPDHSVYGTFFKILGKPATPMQFYLTDSTSHFFRGVLYFDNSFNYDSLAPVLNFIETDINHLAQTLHWNIQ